MRFILKDIRQWRFRYEALRFGVLTLVVVLFWVGIEIFNTYTITTIPEDYTQAIEPLSPTLDLEVLHEIEGRLKVDETFKVIKEAEDPNDPTVDNSKNSSASASPAPTSSGLNQ